MWGAGRVTPGTAGTRCPSPLLHLRGPHQAPASPSLGWEQPNIASAYRRAPQPQRGEWFRFLVDCPEV